jgi:transposase
VNLINMPGWTVTGTKTNKDDYCVSATYDSGGTPSCAKCSTLFSKVYRHGSRQQTIMDLPAHGKRVGIELNRKRYRCQNCESTFLQDLPDVDERSQMTRRLARYIEEQSVRRTFTSIADEVGVDEKTVRNLFRAYVERLDAEVIFETPERMGMDEVHLLKKPRAVFTNLTEATIIAVLPERTKKVVLAHLKTIPDREKVKVVTMDMWKPYADSVRETMPGAAIVVDKFHVVRMASVAMEVVRKAQRGALEAKFRRKLMHDRFVLLRRTKDLDDEQKATMEGWFAQFPKLKQAYELKESFYGLWDIPQKADAQTAYSEWERSITDTELLTAYRPLLTAMLNWRSEIFAYWDHRATNALTESLNGVAKSVQRAGRGYSFDAIRAKMLYSKHLQKMARRPKYNAEVMERDIQFSAAGDDFPASLGTDIRRLLESLHHEATKRE